VSTTNRRGEALEGLQQFSLGVGRDNGGFRIARTPR